MPDPGGCRNIGGTFNYVGTNKRTDNTANHRFGFRVDTRRHGNDDLL